MHLFIKCIMFSVWMWFIVRFSEKPSGRRKIWIDNRFLYVFTWLWHSYGEISIMGLMYAIGVQVVDIIGVVFYLLMPLNREIICIYWLKFLLGVLFWAAGIGIFDMAKNAEEKREKILAFVIGIFDLKFMLECKKEQKNNKAGAFIYVGDKKIIWIFGILFYIISVLEWVILLFSIEVASLFLFLFCCCMVQLGFATFLCQHFTYSAVFIKENEVFYYAERKLKNIPIGQINGVSAMPGNVAYLFFNEKKERLFELQMKKANARKMLEYIIDRQQNN